MSQPIRFILIDDDPSNNLICKFAIKSETKKIDIIDFLEAERALDFIQSEPTLDANKEKNIILLDINMPIMNGWDFLDSFEKLNSKIKDAYTIYILTSSIDHADIEKAKKHPLVKSLLVKPINKSTVFDLLAQIGN